MEAATQYHVTRNRERPIRDWFVLHNQRGSHQRYRHDDGRRITVTLSSGGDTFPLGTLRSMIEGQAKWTEADLRRLSLLR